MSDGATIGWMKKIIVNECLMHLRSANSFLQLTEVMPETVVDPSVLDQLSAARTSNEKPAAGA